MTLLRKLPTDPIIAAAIKGDYRSLNELVGWFRDLFRVLGSLNSISWDMVNKAGSRLSDIVTRPHSDLQTILGWQTGADVAQVRHISQADGKVWQDHVEVTDANPHGTDHSQLNAIAELDPTSADATKDKHLSNAQGKVWQDHSALTSNTHHGLDHDATYAPIAKGVTNGDSHDHSGGDGGQIDHGGTAGLGDDDHSQYLLLAGRAGQTAATPLIFGDAADNTTFETDGTAKFNGAATVWKDVMFPMAPPKTTGAGNPTLTTYNGNLRGYSFAVNDVHDFDPQEQEHDSKVGSTATFHVHWLSRSNDGTDRAVKWELEYDVEPGSGALPATVVASVEITLPASSAVNTVFRDNITTFTITAIARLVGARIKRIASVGTAPSVDPVLRALHFHYEIDTVGSRQITTK